MANKKFTPVFIGIPDELVVPGSVALVLAAFGGLTLPADLWKLYYSALMLISSLVGAWFIAITLENWHYFNKHPNARRPSLIRACFGLAIGVLFLLMAMLLTLRGISSVMDTSQDKASLAICHRSERSPQTMTCTLVKEPSHH